MVHLLGDVRAVLQPLLNALHDWIAQTTAAQNAADTGPAQGDAGALAGLEGATGAAGATDGAIAAVQQLQHLLLADDPAAPEFFQHNGAVLKAALGVAYPEVGMHTLNFDFEKALDAIASVTGAAVDA